MSIRERLEDADLLWQNGRKQGAWISILIAADATAKLRFPNANNPERFTAFIKEVIPTIISGASPKPGGITVMLGDRTNAIALHDLLYKNFRCALVHEGTLDVNVRLSESRIIDGKPTADFVVGSPIEIPDFWALNLAFAVQNAPENVATCAKNPIFIKQKAL